MCGFLPIGGKPESPFRSYANNWYQRLNGGRGGIRARNLLFSKPKYTNFSGIQAWSVTIQNKNSLPFTDTYDNAQLLLKAMLIRPILP